MDLVFCGTPQFAVPTLDALVEHKFRVRLVVTQPDRPSGRGMETSAPPVKRRAAELGLPVTQPDRIRDNADFRARLEALGPQAIIVVGYGRILPQWMIDLPPLGNLNLHASLLPKYRGAAPIQWAIASGETVTGVTTMRIDAGLDTGDILLQQEIPIAPADTAVSLAPGMAVAGARLMVETLRLLAAGEITPRAQDASRASLAPILKKEDGQIDFQRSARDIHNRLRGFQPWPGIYSSFRGRHFQIHAAEPVEHASAAPGALAVEPSRLIAGCGGGTGLELLEVQIEGKKKMSGRDFVNGYRPASDERLGV